MDWGPVEGAVAPLLEAVSVAKTFAAVPDPRKPRGIRHPLAFILNVAAAATLAGERRLTAMAQWAAGQDVETLRRLGSTKDKAPSEPTIRRNLGHPDVAKEFDARTCARKVTLILDMLGL